MFLEGGFLLLFYCKIDILFNFFGLILAILGIVIYIFFLIIIKFNFLLVKLVSRIATIEDLVLYPVY